MPSKLSIHLNAYPAHVYDVIAHMQPSVVKVFNQSSEMNIDAIRAYSPNTIIVYRHYTNLDYHSPADAFFAEIGDTLRKLRGRGILWEGINEPVINSADEARAVNAWFVRFAELMHAEGEMVAGFSWSTGNPANFGMVVPYVVEAAAAVDVHAVHEYYSTWGGEKDWCRYRAFEAALPAHARKPVVITEAGLDDNGDPYTGGYRGKKTEQEYLEILQRYDALLLQDPYVLGATVFQWGDWGWPSFELSPMINLLTSYVASVGGGAIAPKPWPKPIFPPTCSFTVSPEKLFAGQSATLTWNAQDASAVTLDGAAVAASGSAVVTPTATTTYTLHVVFLDGSTRDLSVTLTVFAPPTYAFSVTPASIIAGQAATLAWNVTGARAVTLDGQTVAAQGTQVVAPTETTTFTLQIVFLDDTVQALSAMLQVNPSAPPQITHAALSPAVLGAGDLLNISITVRNNSGQTLSTQGPDSGFVYDEGDTFRTRGFPETRDAFRVGVDFDGRSGIDHPYRWGLGAPLAPGESATITGAIRLRTARAVNYWAGLVREQIAWLEDRQGVQTITVTPAGAPLITAVALSPTTLPSGALLNVSITVKNNSNETLSTQGPEPGFVYDEGATFYTHGFPETSGTFRVGIDFDGRTGIDHPYRWGLGTPLAPGASATITGAIRLRTARTINYWAGLVRERIAWLQDRQGVRQVTVSPTGVPQITAVALSPTTLPSGALLNVSITVKNDSNETLPTQGPEPGFVYEEGDTFYTRGFAETGGNFRVGVDFDGRIGVDHPYRWGLGAPLAPGESATITGAIRLRAARAINYWAGLVRERIAWLDDRRGVQQITVTVTPP